MDVHLLLEHLVNLTFYLTALQVKDCAWILLTGTVHACVCLQVCLYGHYWTPVDNGVCRVECYTMACSLWLNDQDAWIFLCLKSVEYFCALSCCDSSMNNINGIVFTQLVRDDLNSVSVGGRTPVLCDWPHR